MILAAGFGTRLASRGVPKPLVHAAGRPMIAWVIDALRHAGCSDLVVNVHHHAEQLSAYLLDRDHGVPVHVIREQDILGTGGGVLNAARLLDNEEPFLLHNADIYSAQDLRSMVRAHRDSGALATLLVNRRETARALLFDSAMRFLGKEAWKDDGTTFAGDVLRRGFCGIHILSSAVFHLDFPDGFSDIFEIYRTALDAGHTLRGFESDAYWTDLGTEDRIQAFNEWKSLHS